MPTHVLIVPALQELLDGRVAAHRTDRKRQRPDCVRVLQLRLRDERTRRP